MFAEIIVVIGWIIQGNIAGKLFEVNGEKNE